VEWEVGEVDAVPAQAGIAALAEFDARRYKEKNFVTRPKHFVRANLLEIDGILKPCKRHLRSRKSFQK
jgi:hypothetical protein